MGTKREIGVEHKRQSGHLESPNADDYDSSDEDNEDLSNLDGFIVSSDDDGESCGICHVGFDAQDRLVKCIECLANFHRFCLNIANRMVPYF